VLSAENDRQTVELGLERLTQEQMTASCATTAAYQSLNSASLPPSRTYLSPSPNIRCAHVIIIEGLEARCAAVRKSPKRASGGEADMLQRRPDCSMELMCGAQEPLKRTDTCDQRSNSCAYQPIR